METTKTREEKKEAIKKIILESDKLLTTSQKDRLLHWIKTENKPGDKNSNEYKSFYFAYGKLRKAKKIIDLLIDLDLIKNNNNFDLKQKYDKIILENQQLKKEIQRLR